MKMDRKLTVILPTFNRLNYLKNAYNSLLSQSNQKFDLIIIDNYSTDGTQDFLKEIEIESKFEDFTIILNNKNVGSVTSLKIAMSRVKTSWVTILCDDDYFDEKYIEIMLRTIEKTNKSIVLSSFRAIDDGNNILYVKKYSTKSLDLNNAIINVILSGEIAPAGISGFCFNISERNCIIKDYVKGFLVDTMIIFEAIIHGNGIDILDDVIFNRRIWSQSESSFSKDNLLSYNQALLDFNKDVEEIVQHNNRINILLIKRLKKQSLYKFIHITIKPIFLNSYFCIKDISNYHNIYKGHRGYYLRVVVLVIAYLMCNKFTVKFRVYFKRLYRWLKRL